MGEKLTEFRCSLCPPIVRGALLFKAAGNAVVETKCPRCGKFVKIEIKTRDWQLSIQGGDYEAAKKDYVRAND